MSVRSKYYLGAAAMACLFVVQVVLIASGDGSVFRYGSALGGAVGAVAMAWAGRLSHEGPATSGDRSTFAVRANYWSGRRALGGRLTLTSAELRFEPHRLEMSLGGRATYGVRFEQIVTVAVGRWGLVPRKRLSVRTQDGSEACFLIPDVAARAEDIARAAATPVVRRDR